eukprot:6845815-Pyramimonas_sp.AAC.1
MAGHAAMPLGYVLVSVGSAAILMHFDQGGKGDVFRDNTNTDDPEQNQDALLLVLTFAVLARMTFLILICEYG